MAFSRAVLLVVFAVLLISAEVSALRDLAETTTTPTTHGRGGFGGNGGNGGSSSCNRISNPRCTPARPVGGGGSYGGSAGCNPRNRTCYHYGGKGGNGGKGGRGGHGPPETRN